MSDEIYNNVTSDNLVMMDDIYENTVHLRKDPDCRTNTHQQLHNTESVYVKRYRAATVCLVLLCFLLLMVIILMSVQTKRSTEERNQLLTNISNITDQRNQLLTNISNITDQRNQLLTNINSITNQKKQLLTNISNLIRLNEKLNQDNKKTLNALTELDGWIYYKHSFYFISTAEKSWTDSRSYCTDRNADLVIINSKEEQDFVRSKAGDDAWIGLTDKVKESDWKWFDGTKPTLSFWRSGEPNNHEGEEDCAVTKPNGWNDRSCNAQIKWICEKNF